MFSSYFFSGKKYTVNVYLNKRYSLFTFASLITIQLVIFNPMGPRSSHSSRQGSHSSNKDLMEQNNPNKNKGQRLRYKPTEIGVCAVAWDCWLKPIPNANNPDEYEKIINKCSETSTSFIADKWPDIADQYAELVKLEYNFSVLLEDIKKRKIDSLACLMYRIAKVYFNSICFNFTDSPEDFPRKKDQFDEANAIDIVANVYADCERLMKAIFSTWLHLKPTAYLDFMLFFAEYYTEWFDIDHFVDVTEEFRKIRSQYVTEVKVETAPPIEDPSVFEIEMAPIPEVYHVEPPVVTKEEYHQLAFDLDDDTDIPLLSTPAPEPVAKPKTVASKPVPKVPTDEQLAGVLSKTKYSEEAMKILRNCCNKLGIDPNEMDSGEMVIPVYDLNDTDKIWLMNSFVSLSQK